MAGEKRFKRVFREGNSLQDDGLKLIMVDSETGVHYLLWKAGYGAGITPLLDADGKPIVEKNPF